jgi:hypothetical protein
LGTNSPPEEASTQGLKCKTKKLPIFRHFDCSSVFSGSQVEKIGNPGQKCENWKNHRMKNNKSAMKLSQIRRRIEICLREIIVRFEMNLQNLLFTGQLNSYLYFKASTKVDIITNLNKKHSYTCKNYV